MQAERLEALRAALPFATDSAGEAGAAALVAAALAAAAATALLARLAARVGLVDAGARDDAPGDRSGDVSGDMRPRRKRQERPVPPVGGPALLVGAAVGWLVAGGDVPRPGAAALATLLLACVVGLADDLAPRGLRPRAKLFGQVLAALPAALAVADESGWWPAAFVLFGAVVAMNALNTFDNADGAAAGLGVAALGGPLAIGAAALLGFLPFNANGASGPSARGRAGRAAHAGRPAPSAYLGDSGSHLVGMAILLAPPAWPALALPLLDLTRVAVLRLRAGQAPWIGDRRHLAHRLQERGLGTAGVVLALLAVALPSLLAADAAAAGGSLRPLVWGLSGTAALFALAVLATRPPAGDGGVDRIDQ